LQRKSKNDRARKNFGGGLEGSGSYLQLEGKKWANRKETRRGKRKAGKTVRNTRFKRGTRAPQHKTGGGD